jgi:uncharacterized protein (TIGR03790 family)
MKSMSAPGAKLRQVLAALLALAFGPLALADTPDRVLVVVNENSTLSKSIAEYYVNRRGVPFKNVCRIRTAEREEIERVTFNDEIARPVGACLKSKGLVESIYYIVTTAGVPLKITGSGGVMGDHASVDSELALTYGELKGTPPHELPGSVPNPFYGKRDASFGHPQFPIYLVTRLAAYDLADVKAMVDRCLVARNRGKFVIDVAHTTSKDGDEWLRDAAIFLPGSRVILEDSTHPIYDQVDVIGFASWGSNDLNRKRRSTGFRWLPGAIVTEYVSTDGRTFQTPPASWTPNNNWQNRFGFFLNTPQSLAADYLREGATGASGHVYEPYLAGTPRPDYLLPAYYSGRNLAESYYLAIRGLSWQNIVIGDPICSLGKP